MLRDVRAAATGRSAPLSVAERLDATAGADLAEIASDLELELFTYRAALAATARVPQPSLVDFLR